MGRGRTGSVDCQDTTGRQVFSPSLEAALAQLSLEERNILMLRVFEEKSYAEMSGILNISANALNKRMKRIIRKVRQAYIGGGDHLGRDVSHEYQDIIQASVGMKRIPQIDVEEQVMQQISRLKVTRHASRIRIGSKSAIAVSMVLLLMISVSAYAASEYIQIRSREGAAKVQYEGAAPPASSAYTQSYTQYEQQTRVVARLGELVAYYIKGQNLSGNGDPGLNFVFMERRMTAYSDFKKEITRTGAPVFPESLGGYSLDYGSISPEAPRAAEEGENDSLYKNTLEKLTAQANKETAGEKLFLKVLPWSKPSSVNGTYSKGGAYIGISATLLYGGNVYVKQEVENAASKIKVGDTEVVYNSVNKGAISYHFLNWYNEPQDAWYILTTYGDHTLSKDELLRLAKDFL